MGGTHSRDGPDFSDSDSDSETHSQSSHSESETQTPNTRTPDSNLTFSTPDPSLDSLDRKLQSLHIKYAKPISSSPNPNPKTPDAVKLYLHVGGSSSVAKWVPTEKLTRFSFSRRGSVDGDEEDDEEDGNTNSPWHLVIGTRIRVLVGTALQLKSFPDQKRVDFIADGVWAIKFLHPSGFSFFSKQYQDCLFENTYHMESNQENKLKVYGKDFLAWADPNKADDSIWEDAKDSFGPNKPKKGPKTPLNLHSRELLEEFEEESSSQGGIQSLALGALDNSFLVGNSGIQVVKNFSHGVHGKGITVNFSSNSNSNSNSNSALFSTPKKALLMRAETNMLLMSPSDKGKPHTTGVHQIDIETGKLITQWKFGKDGADISMRDITNDSKGSQLDPSESTFLGLDDNRLCRWDMRDKNGIVSSITESSPVLNWTQGHNFSRGTNFQCFASTGDGSIVVGSLDGKIRLYSKSSMRMAKTAFPGLGSPVTHVDVTYDGKWILGTTDTYLVLICTMFVDKDGKEKTGFGGRMGNRIAAPRLLKLYPVDCVNAGVDNKFRGGQFSWVTENGREERHLVATVGKFSVIWNFQQVKDSSHECYENQEGLKSCYCYKVIPKTESIVDSRFMHEKFAAVGDSPEAPLVVATPMKVSSFSIGSRLRN